jgi:hypothetical protein
MRSADPVRRCPSSEAKRKTSTRGEYSHFDPKQTTESPPLFGSNLNNGIRLRVASIIRSRRPIDPNASHAECVGRCRFAASLGYIDGAARMFADQLDGPVKNSAVAPPTAKVYRCAYRVVWPKLLTGRSVCRRLITKSWLGLWTQPSCQPSGRNESPILCDLV